MHTISRVLVFWFCALTREYAPQSAQADAPQCAPCLLLLGEAARAGVLFHVSRRAAKVSEVGPTRGQEVWAEAAHGHLGHVGERLAHRTAEEEGPDLLVERHHVRVAYDGV